MKPKSLVSLVPLSKTEDLSAYEIKQIDTETYFCEDNQHPIQDHYQGLEADEGAVFCEGELRVFSLEFEGEGKLEGDQELLDIFERTGHELLAFKTQSPAQRQVNSSQILNSLEHCKLKLIQHYPPSHENPTIKLPDPVLDRGKYELWKDRKDKNETPIAFLRRVWGKYIDAGLMYQVNLKGQQRTATNQNPKKALDKTLFDMASRECLEKGIRLSNYLPTKSHEIDHKLNSIDKSTLETLKKLRGSAQRRKIF